MTGMRILVLVLAAHGDTAKREWEFLILWPEGGPLSCSRAQLQLGEGLIHMSHITIGLDTLLPQVRIRCQEDINRLPSSE
jgi:hypothetical protein